MLCLWGFVCVFSVITCYLDGWRPYWVVCVGTGDVPIWLVVLEIKPFAALRILSPAWKNGRTAPHQLEAGTRVHTIVKHDGGVDHTRLVGLLSAHASEEDAGGGL